jgi:isopentenyl phosphate kinase
MLTILKLGGALLTDKSRPDSLRTDLLARIAREIAACRADGLIDDLILVHGVGSYGHLPVLQHNLHRGFRSPDQLLPFSRTQSQVMILRSAIIAALQDAGVPAVLMLPSSGMTAENFRIRQQFLDPVAGFLRIGMTPVLGGDVLADAAVGFSVYGGDAISVDLAMHFSADHLLFATDVDGVFTADPRQSPDAHRIPELSLGQLDSVTLSGREMDVSGAMAGKLREIARAQNRIAAGMTVRLFSMLEPGQLRAILTGADGGTRIVS